MATTHADETKAREEAERKLRNTRDPLEKLRYMIIAREGANGINAMTRSMKPFDEDGDKTIDFAEFLKGVSAVGLRLGRDESRAMFESMDRDRSGRIDYYEFLKAVRPEMSRHRRDQAERIFRHMDRTGSGYITGRDLLYYFDAKGHPDYQSGRHTTEELEERLLKELGATGRNREVSREDFMNYFAGVSFAMDNDGEFDKMVRESFKV